MCDFQKGEEVVCVDDSPGRARGDSCDLRRGATYVVLDILFGVRNAVVLDILFGVRNAVRVSGSSRYWSADRFRRPIVDESEVDTDAEVLA